MFFSTGRPTGGENPALKPRASPLLWTRPGVLGCPPLCVDADEPCDFLSVRPQLPPWSRRRAGVLKTSDPKVPAPGRARAGRSSASGRPWRGFSPPGARRSAHCAPTSTEVRRVNVPFSHPSDLYPQKDGRKVRSRWEGTFTFRPGAARAPGSAARPAHSLRTPRARPAHVHRRAGRRSRPVGRGHRPTTDLAQTRHRPGRTGLTGLFSQAAPGRRWSGPPALDQFRRIQTGVELTGLEPVTPCLQSRCATNCAIAPGEVDGESTADRRRSRPSRPGR